MTTQPKRILFVLTSHDRKGAPGDTTAPPSGFYLSEVSHPYHVLHAAGYSIDFVSPKGGKTHVDGLDLNDPLNAEFWNNPALRAQTYCAARCIRAARRKAWLLSCAATGITGS